MTAPRRAPIVLRALMRGLAFTHTQLLRIDLVLMEIPVLLRSPALERAALDAHYAHARSYAQPRNQRSGLYPFEQRMLERFFPEPPGHLLVHGAGAGREVLALSGMGYSVDAFEPVPEMLEWARRAIGKDVKVRLARMTLQQWSEHPEGRYDAVVCGWGMWMHILDQHSRLSALRAFRQVCPEGPVLISFWRRGQAVDTTPRPVPLHPEPETRLEKLTRGALRRWLGLPPVERGTVWAAGLYLHCSTEAEIREEAELAGYEVAYYERDSVQFPHAVLVPAGR